jgi:hypothetical protein
MRPSWLQLSETWEKRESTCELASPRPAVSATQRRALHTAAPPKHADAYKPHRSNTCGKAFSTSSHLVRHMGTHTGEKPHRCDTCGMAFSTSSHLATHAGVKGGPGPRQTQRRYGGGIACSGRGRGRQRAPGGGGRARHGRARGCRGGGGGDSLLFRNEGERLARLPDSEKTMPHVSLSPVCVRMCAVRLPDVEKALPCTPWPWGSPHVRRGRARGLDCCLPFAYWRGGRCLVARRAKWQVALSSAVMVMASTRFCARSVEVHNLLPRIPSRASGERIRVPDTSPQARRLSSLDASKTPCLVRSSLVLRTV